MTWHILHLPAIDEDGNPLWPEYFPKEKLLALRQQLGGPIFDTMYMGRPEALSGEIFQRDWFKPCKLVNRPDGLAIARSNGEVVSVSECIVFQYWDLAISEKQTADYTVCLTLAVYPTDMSLYVLDVVRGHQSFDETQRSIARQGDFWTPNVVGIESVAYQAAAVQAAKRNTLLPIREVRVDRDKVTRARLPATFAESGKIEVVQAHWTDEFLAELVAFPGGKHDDMVDALSGACAIAQTYVPSSFFLWE